jgi:hypothetical protein
MSGGKGGSTTSSVEIPEYIEEAARRNLAKAEDISQIGYVPYYGPDVAAFTPFQEAGFQQTADVASAFGVGPQMSQTDIMGGMPAPTEFAGGVRGYSSAPLYQQAVDELAAQRPAQAQFIESFFIDPVTGQVGSRVPTTSPVAPVSPVDSGGGGVAPKKRPKKRPQIVAPVSPVVPDTVLTPTELSDYATIIAGEDYDPRTDILTPKQRVEVESPTPEGTAARIAQEDIAMNIPFPETPFEPDIPSQMGSVLLPDGSYDISNWYDDGPVEYVPDTALTPTELSDYATIIAGEDYDPRTDILTPEQRVVVESATPEGTAARIAQEDIAMNIAFPRTPFEPDIPSQMGSVLLPDGSYDISNWYDDGPVTGGGGLLSDIGEFIASGGVTGAALRGVGGLLEPALGAAESGIASMIGDPRTFAERDADRLEAERLRAIDRSQEESAAVQAQTEAARTEQEKLKVSDPEAFVAQFGKEGKADAKKAVKKAQKLAVAPRPPSLTSDKARDWIKANLGISVDKKDATDYIRSLQRDWDRQNG